MARDSFIFYRSFAEAIDDLPDKEQLEIYKAIKEYALNENEIELTGMAKGFFKLIKPQIAANNRRYKNGCGGGRPAEKEEPTENQELTETEPNNNLEETEQEPNTGQGKNRRKSKRKPNENDNDNENVNENDNGNEKTESQKAADVLSQLLLTSHRKEFPDFLSGKTDKQIVKKLDGWAEEIEKLIRIDKKAPDVVEQVILWVKTPGNFWFHNIESGKKLREKFERLYGQMATDKRSSNGTSAKHQREKPALE